MVLSLRYKPDIVLHKKPLIPITCKTSYGKQFRGYRAKGCKEFIFIFGEIKVKLKAAKKKKKNLQLYIKGNA